jgi:hypothetical protein
MTNSEASRVLERLKLYSPTREELTELMHELKLDPTQERALVVTLKHIEEDLAHMQSERDKAPPRPQLVRRLKRMEHLFAEILSEMERANAGLIHFLPSDTLAAVGKAMTFTALTEALGREAIPERDEKWRQAKISAGEKQSLDEIEAATRASREVLGLKHGDLILKDFLAKIHDPMRRWVEKDRQNKGGKPAKITRRIIVYWLAWNAPEIINRKATVAETGPFVELCAAVLRTYRLSDSGVDKVIPKIVKQVREDQGRNKSGHRGPE